MTLLIAGCDPSSSKLAFCVTPYGDSLDLDMWVAQLSTESVRLACAQAYDAAEDLIYRYSKGDQVHLYLEDAVFGRGGPGGTIPQVRIAGAIYACFGHNSAFIMGANNSQWKKQVLGTSKLNKKSGDIGKRLATIWPAAYQKAGIDGDLHDAACIQRFGMHLERLATDRIVRKQMTIKQPTATRPRRTRTP